MRGPCGPRKTLPGAPEAFFGSAEPTVHLIPNIKHPTAVPCFAYLPNYSTLFLGSVRTPPALN